MSFSFTFPETCSETCSCSETCPKTCPKTCFFTFPETCSDTYVKTCSETCSETCPMTCSFTFPETCSDTCVKTCSETCSETCPKTCSFTFPETCSDTYLKTCSCSETCPKTCSFTFPETCSDTYLKTCSCSETCPKTCSFSFPKTCSDTCVKTCSETCPKSSFSSVSMASKSIIGPRRCGTVAPKAYSVYGCSFGEKTRMSTCSYHLNACSPCGRFGARIMTGGCYDFLQKSEKATMQDLNDRLASYLDKVHFLETANATLEKQIREYCEKKGLICQRDYSCYYKTIDCLQEKVQNGRLVKMTLL